MKHLLTLAFLFFFSIDSFAAPRLQAMGEERERPPTSVTIEPDQLVEQVENNLARVPEFAFIMKDAKENGYRVWLFGGTASAFAHYTKWDYLRTHGDTRYQAERFDYDYTNIYRSNQDLDIVIDGPSDSAYRLQKLLTEKFPHLQGEKGAWEVRTLRTDLGDKEALLENPDFLNQHTDSHSVGMIELSQTKEPRIRDLRDWGNPRPNFLRDVAAGRLKYYFSSKHETTKRFKQGKNPPILSVVRYFIKAFQFELEPDPSDEGQLRRIIEAFDPKKMKDSERSWLTKNAPKLYQNAVNIEYASIVLERFGLLEKLRAIDNPQQLGSASWWLSKEPLKSFPVGRGQGKTARELGIDVVAHETGDLQAFESITRAHKGDPNVFISRDGAVGEAAVHGNGFYTARGTKGARGTNITIRFSVDPEARDGVDFKNIGDFVVFMNKSALRVIPETLNIGFRDYFRLLIENQVDVNERAKIEKLKRRLSNSIFSDAKTGDLKWLDGVVAKELRSKNPSRILISEWLSLSKPLQRGFDPRFVMRAAIAGELKGLGEVLAPYFKDEAASVEKMHELTKDFVAPNTLIKAYEVLGLEINQVGFDEIVRMIKAETFERASIDLVDAFDYLLFVQGRLHLRGIPMKELLAQERFREKLDYRINDYYQRRYANLTVSYVDWLAALSYLAPSNGFDHYRTTKELAHLFDTPERSWRNLRPYIFQTGPFQSFYIDEMYEIRGQVPTKDVIAIVDRLLTEPALEQQSYRLQSVLRSFEQGWVMDQLSIREAVELRRRIAAKFTDSPYGVVRSIDNFEWQKKAIVTPEDIEWLKTSIASSLDKPSRFELDLFMKYGLDESSLGLLNRVLETVSATTALELLGKFRSYRNSSLPLWAVLDERFWANLVRLHSDGSSWQFGQYFTGSPFGIRRDLDMRIIETASRLDGGLKSLFDYSFNSNFWTGKHDVLLLAIEKAYSEPVPSLVYRLSHRSDPAAKRWKDLLETRRAAKNVLSHDVWRNDPELRRLLANNRILRRFMTPGNLALAIEAQNESGVTTPHTMLRTCQAIFAR